MREKVMAITYRPRWLAWRLYSWIIRRFALRGRDVRWYTALALVAVGGAYAGRWHWLFPAVAWSLVTMIAVASQTLDFAQRTLTTAHEEIIQGYEEHLEELSQSVRYAELMRDSRKETLDVADGYIRTLREHQQVTERLLDIEREGSQRRERMLTDIFDTVREWGTSGRQPSKGGRREGSRNLPEHIRRQRAEDYCRRRARGQSRVAAAGLVGHHPDRLELWARELGIDCI